MPNVDDADTITPPLGNGDLLTSYSSPVAIPVNLRSVFVPAPSSIRSKFSPGC